MSKSVSPIPDGYTAVTPYLIVKGAAKALDFYVRVLGAKEILRMDGPNGTIGHAEIEIGEAKIMLADEWPDGNCMSPETYGGSSVLIHLYVPDVDKVFAAALAGGATERDKLEDKFYGDRGGTFADPFGHVWYVATHIEDLSEEEIRRRGEEYMAQAGSD